jgi:hypothetical protein
MSKITITIDDVELEYRTAKDIQNELDAYVGPKIRYVSVPSTNVVYYNNGERKTYCVTTVDTWAVACTCPDYHFRRRVCKHMDSVGAIFEKGAEI